jgi:hypothetical protein
MWRCSHQANEEIKLFELAEQYKRLSNKVIGPLTEVVSVIASCAVAISSTKGQAEVFMS